MKFKMRRSICINLAIFLASTAAHPGVAVRGLSPFNAGAQDSNSWDQSGSDTSNSWENSGNSGSGSSDSWDNSGSSGSSSKSVCTTTPKVPETKTLQTPAQQTTESKTKDSGGKAAESWTQESKTKEHKTWTEGSSYLGEFVSSFPVSHIHNQLTQLRHKQ